MAGVVRPTSSSREAVSRPPLTGRGFLGVTKPHFVIGEKLFPRSLGFVTTGRGRRFCTVALITAALSCGLVLIQQQRIVS